MGPNEYALFKPRWGAVYRTPLAELLADHGVETLIFAGCNMPNCPWASIIQANERDFRVVLVTGASDQGYGEIAGICTTLMPTDEVIAAVHSAH